MIELAALVMRERLETAQQCGAVHAAADERSELALSYSRTARRRARGP
jgi:hypothetical protein